MINIIYNIRTDRLAGGPGGYGQIDWRRLWVFIKGGCSRRGVQWMGVVL